MSSGFRPSPALPSNSLLARPPASMDRSLAMIYNTVKTVLQDAKMFNKFEVFMHGSRVTGVAELESDLDLVILVRAANTRD